MRPRAVLPTDVVRWTITDNDQLFDADQYRPLIVAYHNGAPVRLGDIAKVHDAVEDITRPGLVERQAAASCMHHIPPARRQHRRHGGPDPRACFRCCKPRFRRRSILHVGDRPHDHDPRVGEGHSDHAADHRRAGDPGDFRFPAQRLGHDHSRPWPCRCRWSARSA